MAEGRQTETPGLSRLLELLHSSYLRQGVRKSVASKLEQVSLPCVYCTHVHLCYCVYSHTSVLTMYDLQAESRLQSSKRHYFECSLLYSELSAMLHHQHPSTHLQAQSRSDERGGGRGVLAAGEAQHCLRLHPEASLLGVTTNHLRLAGGRALSGVSVHCL